MSALWLEDDWPVCLIEADRLDIEATTINQTNVAVSCLFYSIYKSIIILNI